MCIRDRSLSEWNITVHSIAPGWIQTHDYAQLQPEDHSQHPSRRVGKPEDIARMCLFLCEENNDFINGENKMCIRDSPEARFY